MKGASPSAKTLLGELYNLITFCFQTNYYMHAHVAGNLDSYCHSANSFKGHHSVPLAAKIMFTCQDQWGGGNISGEER